MFGTRMTSNRCQGKICDALEERDEDIITSDYIFMSHNCKINAQNDNIISNDYAEVRVLLDQYYEITARKYGTFHDYDSKKVSKELKDISIEDGTEGSINRKEGIVGDLFENDILLTLPQVKALLNEDIKSIRWQNLIRTALRHIEAETCVRFKESSGNRDHIYFTQRAGCWSNVGRIGGRQLISIGYGCESMGIVTHEVLHALGIWHEQSRSDRDNNIWINYANIYPGTQGNFEKRTTLNTDNMGLSYDFGSVMHYGSKAFTISFNRYTIETHDRRYQQTIGQRGALSFKDAKMINLGYCNDTCNYQMICYNGGYTNPNNCYQCKCPSGLGGTNCLSVEKSNKTPKCGGELWANNSYQTINSINLRGNIHCVWRIRSKAQVLLYVDELKLPCKNACTSYLELKFKQDMIPTGTRHCCGPPNAWIASEMDTIIIIYLVNDDFDGQGFKLRYKLSNIPPFKGPTYKNLVTTITWSKWGLWSACSATCGGCGKRRRVRACYSKNQHCPGPKEEMEECGKKRCQIWKNYNCIGRLVMPCSLYHKIQFATDKADIYIPPADSLAVDQYKYKQYVKSAFSGERLCEKYFHYFCPMSTLTVYMGWKGENNWLKLNKQGCCDGYYYNGTICVPY
ncbi:unnamed protein product [Cercopithifilaria johnstoni]|uniref:Metalloendopeptidase n=1 Tax=Cercopithifilaria johnstoni TaxID=2874296 RepID=A0A8J2M8W9_9BILA|nr:unnamed protein product [Cercopithifilaria johnstoni]